MKRRVLIACVLSAAVLYGAGTTINGARTILNGLILGTDNSAAGTLQIANGSANAHTILTSGATTTNTIAGFTAVPTTGHLVTCTSSGTTCTLTDGGAVPAAGVTSVNGQTGAVTGTGAALVLLEHHTASTSASLDFTCPSASYDVYKIDFVNVVLSTSAIFGIQVKTISGFDIGSNYSWGWNYLDNASAGRIGSSSSTTIQTRDINSSMSSGGSINGELILYNPLSASFHKIFQGQLTIGTTTSTNDPVSVTGFGQYNPTTALTGFRGIPSAGTLTSGDMYCYGVAKS